MATYTLRPRPLTKASFAAFGEVIDCSDVTPLIINKGNTERYDTLARIELNNDATDHAAISLFRAQPRTLPMRIKMLERHPRGSQCFQPLSGEPYFVLVANAVEHPQPEDLHLFIAQSDQGVNYKQNTWHHPVLALNKVCDFLVIDRKGPGHNCEEYMFNDEIELPLLDDAMLTRHTP